MPSVAVAGLDQFLIQNGEALPQVGDLGQQGAGDVGVDVFAHLNVFAHLGFGGQFPGAPGM